MCGTSVSIGQAWFLGRIAEHSHEINAWVWVECKEIHKLSIDSSEVLGSKVCDFVLVNWQWICIPPYTFRVFEKKSTHSVAWPKRSPSRMALSWLSRVTTGFYSSLQCRSIFWWPSQSSQAFSGFPRLLGQFLIWMETTSSQQQAQSAAVAETRSAVN